MAITEFICFMTGFSIDISFFRTIHSSITKGRGHLLRVLPKRIFEKTSQSHKNNIIGYAWVFQFKSPVLVISSAKGLELEFLNYSCTLLSAKKYCFQFIFFDKSLSDDISFAERLS